MYQLTREDIDRFWMSSDNLTSWQRDWEGWWVCPHFGLTENRVAWCEDNIGPWGKDWSFFDNRYFFENKDYALMFTLKFSKE